MAKPDFQLKWGVNRSGGIPATDPADYQLGWQYRSGLPPLTGNFDYYQNLADERLLYLNAQGISEWDSLTAYDTDAYVKGSDGELYRSTAPTTGNDPTLGAPWTSAQGSDSLNTDRQDVVSAATTILPTDTAHINITGTATISSFTVPADRCYFVRFDAACSLVNSANLVTQRGADIQCAAGDTCWLWATGDNVVEVGGYTSFAPPFSRGYVSPAQIIPPAGSSITLTHGLGAIPKLVSYEYVCSIASGGYSVGDVIDFSAVTYIHSSTMINGFNTVKGPTTLTVRTCSGGAAFLANKVTGATLALASIATNFQLIVRAYA